MPTPRRSRSARLPYQKRDGGGWRRVEKTHRVLVVAGDDDGDAVARELIGELPDSALRVEEEEEGAT
jgi:hypothetical protein